MRNLKNFSVFTTDHKNNIKYSVSVSVIDSIHARD